MTLHITENRDGFAGGQSSYPPHHHPQPEIYHYRFTEPQGYGHAEYGMYYSWVIRHLPDNPYTVPEFTEEHAWVMNLEQPFWDPDQK